MYIYICVDDYLNKVKNHGIAKSKTIYQTNPIGDVVLESMKHEHSYIEYIHYQTRTVQNVHETTHKLDHVSTHLLGFNSNSKGGWLERKLTIRITFVNTQTLDTITILLKNNIRLISFRKFDDLDFDFYQQMRNLQIHISDDLEKRFVNGTDDMIELWKSINDYENRRTLTDL